MVSLATLLLMQTGVTAKQPAYFAAVLIGSLILGGLGWLIASVLGFARARAFGARSRVSIRSRGNGDGAWRRERQTESTEATDSQEKQSNGDKVRRRRYATQAGRRDRRTNEMHGCKSFVPPIPPASPSACKAGRPSNPLCAPPFLRSSELIPLPP